MEQAGRGPRNVNLRILVVTRVKTTQAFKDEALAARTFPSISFATWLLSSATCLVGAVGVAALWSGLQWRFGGNYSWMLPVVVLDAVVLLRLSQFPVRPARVAFILIVSAVTVLLTAALSFAMVLLGALGVAPIRGLQQLSLGMVWLYWWPRLGIIDAGYALLALLTLLWTERAALLRARVRASRVV